MLDRRRFLSRLVAGSLAAGEAATVARADQRAETATRVWVIVGTDWSYNDEFCVSEGNLLTEYAFLEEDAAHRRCAELMDHFRDAEDVNEFIPSDVCLPGCWDEFTKREQWDWLFGETELALDHVFDDSAHGCVPLPYSVRAMRLPPSLNGDSLSQE